MYIEKGKRAQSGIISTVLIILIVLVAIIIVWNVVKNLVVNSTSQIGTESLTIQLEIKEVILPITGGAEIKVYRGPGAGEINKLKLIFEKNNGDSEVVEITDPLDIPGELETKSIIIDIASNPEICDIKSVSLAPIFGSRMGMIAYEPKSGIELDSEGDRVLEAPLDGSLISWWKFDGNAQDSFGANHGTALDGNTTNYDGNTPPNTEGNVLNLDGIDDYVNCSLIRPESITVSIWLKLSNWMWNNTRSSHHIYPYNDGFGIVSSNNHWYTWIRNSTGSRKELYSNKSHTLNEWHNIAITYDRSTGENNMYIDGELNKTQNLGAGEAIGWGGGTRLDFSLMNYSTNGSIDNVMIFNRSLSATEITAIYNNQKGGKI